MKFIDLHCDTISKIYAANENLNNNENDISIDKLKKGNVIVQCFAIFLKYPRKDIFLTCIDMIKYYYQQINTFYEYIRPVFKYNDLIENQKNHKISSILTIEEGNVIEDKLENIDILAAFGVKIMSLTWNVFNNIGYPNDLKNKKVDNHKLTNFGKEVVKKLNQHKIIIDISHLGDANAVEVIKLSKYPVIATHSNIRSVCNHLRNLSDEIILLLKKHHGIIGINFYPNFIKDDKEVLIDDLIKHFIYLKKINCLDIVGFGSDFDGIDEYVKDLNSPTQLNNLILKLKEFNFTDQEIEGICYKNILNFFESNLNI